MITSQALRGRRAKSGDHEDQRREEGDQADDDRDADETAPEDERDERRHGDDRDRAKHDRRRHDRLLDGGKHRHDDGRGERGGGPGDIAGAGIDQRDAHRAENLGAMRGGVGRGDEVGPDVERRLGEEVVELEDARSARTRRESTAAIEATKNSSADAAPRPAPLLVCRSRCRSRPSLRGSPTARRAARRARRRHRAARRAPKGPARRPRRASTSKDDCAWISATPRPSLAPRYSPMTAPSSAEGRGDPETGEEARQRARNAHQAKQLPRAAARRADEIDADRIHRAEAEHGRHERREEDGERGERHLRPVAGKDDDEDRRDRDERRAIAGDGELQEHALDDGELGEEHREQDRGEIAPEISEQRFAKRRPDVAGQDGAIEPKLLGDGERRRDDAGRRKTSWRQSSRRRGSQAIPRRRRADAARPFAAAHSRARSRVPPRLPEQKRAEPVAEIVERAAPQKLRDGAGAAGRSRRARECARAGFPSPSRASERKTASGMEWVTSSVVAARSCQMR